jgi:hypothetical protein
MLSKILAWLSLPLSIAIKPVWLINAATVLFAVSLSPQKKLPAFVCLISSKLNSNVSCA